GARVERYRRTGLDTRYCRVGGDVGRRHGQAEVGGRLGSAVVVDDVLLDDEGGGLVVVGDGAGLRLAIGDGARAVETERLRVAREIGRASCRGARFDGHGDGALDAQKGGDGR